MDTIYDFLRWGWSICVHWKAGLVGSGAMGVVIAALLLVEKLSSRTKIPKKAYAIILVGGFLFVSSFLAWEDEYNQSLFSQQNSSILNGKNVGLLGEIERLRIENDSLRKAPSVSGAQPPLQKPHWIEDLGVYIRDSSISASGATYRIGLTVTTPVVTHPTKIKIEFDHPFDPNVRVGAAFGQGTQLLGLETAVAGNTLYISFDNPSFIPGAPLGVEVKSASEHQSIQPIGAWRWGIK